jgi:hypothetical protein
MRILTLAALVSLVTPCAGHEILVSGFGSQEVHRYDRVSGTYLGPMAQVNQPQALCQGLDGLLYLAVEGDNKIVWIDPATAPATEDFIFDDPATSEDETGGLSGPTGLVQGADGHFYVASFATSEILRYDGANGVFLGAFVTSGSGGLNGPDAGVIFGPDGHLYVPSFFTHEVLRYDGQSGAAMGAFVSAGAGGLQNPRTVVFRSDGSCFVSSEGSNKLLQYDAAGNFLASVYSRPGITGFAISPADGNFYSTSVSRDNVLVHDGTTGASLGTRVSPASGGLDLAVFLTLHPDPNLRMSRLDPAVAGLTNSLVLRNAQPTELQILLIGTQPTSQKFLGCAHLWFGVANPLLVPVLSDGAGEVHLSGTLPLDVMGSTVVLQSFEPASCRISNLTVYSF